MVSSCCSACSKCNRVDPADAVDICSARALCVDVSRAMCGEDCSCVIPRSAFGGYACAGWRASAWVGCRALVGQLRPMDMEQVVVATDTRGRSHDGAGMRPERFGPLSHLSLRPCPQALARFTATAMRRVRAIGAHLRPQPCAAEKAEVLADVREGAGTLTLNRPSALNALTAEMCRSLERHLRSWRAPGGEVRVVLLKSASGKAFSAGGDVKACSVDARASGEGPDVQFRAEYELMHWVRSSPVPQVALVDGVVMGCGAGLAINGAFRVVTERASFAMPEGAIGFFPDVGANWWLPRIPIPGAGCYIALTGVRLSAVDMICAGPAGEPGHLAPSPPPPPLRLQQWSHGLWQDKRHCRVRLSGPYLRAGRSFRLPQTPIVSIMVCVQTRTLT